MIPHRFISLAASGAVGLALVTSIAVAAPDYRFTTLAGSAGVSGSADGAGSGARFRDPTCLVVDKAGNVYVADTGNHIIRKISSTGVVSTLAGLAGNPGNANGSGSAARFNYPDSVAVDGTGTVYVGESQLGTLRKITAGGIVSTLTVVAPYEGPYDLAIDAADLLYAAAGYDGIVQVMPTGAWVRLNITSDWSVNTLALDAAGNFYAAVENEIDHGVLRFPSPPHGAYVWSGPRNAAHAINGAGIIFTAFSNEIGFVSPGVGKVVRLAGADAAGSADGAAADARFNRPSDIAMDGAGNLYVVDRGNQTIRKGTLAASPDTISEYNFITLAGSAGNSGSVDGEGSSARFNRPGGIAVDPDGNVFVSDTDNHTIRKITPDGTVSTLAGLAGASGSTDGVGSVARFFLPQHLAVNPAGRIMVVEANPHVRTITPQGAVATLAPQFHDWPAGVAMDQTGNAYIAQAREYDASSVEKIAGDGTVSTVALVWDGIVGVGGSVFEIGGLDVDGAGNIYVVSYIGHRIDKSSSNHAVTTLVGGFANARDVAVNSRGELYVLDSSTNSIFQTDAAGVLLRTMGSAGSADGPSQSVGFNQPSAIAVDAAGNLYVADTGNHTIRKGVPIVSARTEPSSRLVNASVRANLVEGRRLIAGFVMSGGAKPVLVRAIGPGLAPHMEPGAALAANPRLELYDAGGTVIDRNDDWGGGATLRDMFSALGAFPLAAGNTDAALVHTVAGPQTTHVLTTATGVGLFELYDAAPTNATGPRLVNFSARYEVGGGAGALILGFVIAGTGEKTVLIRGIGPTLLQFGVNCALGDPRIEIFNGAGQRFAQNDNWTSSLASIAAKVGAFALPAGSKDAGMLLTLQPGTYTAVLTGADGGTGEGLVEVYEAQ